MLYSKLYDFTSDHRDINVNVVEFLSQNQILMRAEACDAPKDFYAEVVLPELTVEKSAGFTDDDLIEIRVFLLRNESIIREMLEDMSEPDE